MLPPPRHEMRVCVGLLEMALNHHLRCILCPNKELPLFIPYTLEMFISEAIADSDQMAPVDWLFGK